MTSTLQPPPPAGGLVAVARSGGVGALTRAADQRTRQLVDGFVHTWGPPQAAFAWVALGSHARGELHCASDQDHALLWADDRAAAGSYAEDLAAHVIDGLERFGLRRCDGGYMADRWSISLDDWIATTRARAAAPTNRAVLETEVFLDVRALTGDLDMTAAIGVLAEGARSARLLHGLATAAVGFATPLAPFGRLPHTPVDLKRGGLAAIVLIARLFGLVAGSSEVGTAPRLTAADQVLGAQLTQRLVAAHGVLTRLRLERQLVDAEAGRPLGDTVVPGDLSAADQRALRDALRSVRAGQFVTGARYRTDL